MSNLSPHTCHSLSHAVTKDQISSSPRAVCEGLAGGLEIVVAMLLNHNIRITINNTVIAENSGMIAGNVLISLMFGVEHVAIRFDRCYIHSGYMYLVINFVKL